MSLLFFDGFEGQEGTLLYDLPSTTNVLYSSVTRFSSGTSYQTNNAVANFGKRITASTDIYLGVAFRLTGYPTNTPWDIVALLGDTGTVHHIGVNIKNDGSVELRRGPSTVIAASASGLVALNTWYYLELHGRVSATTGFAEVRLNGTSTPVVSFSGNTKNGGVADLVDAIRLDQSFGSTVYFDDLYVCDGLGTVNNTYLGDVRVQTLFPTGAGSSTGLTPSTAVANWTTVDEAPPSQTDYNGSAVSGTRDTYAMSDLAAGTTGVKGVRHTVAWHKSDAGAASMKHATRIGATNYYGTTAALPSSMTLDINYHETSPATSAPWTVAEVNGVEVGAEVV